MQEETPELSLAEFDSTVQLLRGAQVDVETADSDVCRRIIERATRLWPAPASGDLPSRIGRFQIAERLGQGSHAVAYRGYDPELERDVAIKVSREHPALLRREARKLAEMRNDGVITVYEFVQDDEYGALLVMELGKGQTLRKRLQDGVTRAQAVEWTIGICRVLETIHQQRGVHRDLKPENVLVSDDGRVQLIDFGLIFDECDWTSHAGEVAGTLPYMAPETLQGSAHEVDGRADIWSVGIILFEMLTNARPFSGETRDDLLAAIQKQGVKPPRQLNSRIPVSLERVCLKCLVKDPQGRFTTAADVAHHLEMWLERSGGRRRSSSPWRKLALAVVFLAVAVVAAFGWMGHRDTTAKRGRDSAKPRWSRGLLSDRPQDVAVPKKDKPLDFKWATSKDALVLYGRHFGALKLGEARATPFRFTCRINGNFANQSGLFWGYQETRVGEQKVGHFYSVMVWWSEDNTLAVELYRNRISGGRPALKQTFLSRQRIPFTKEEVAGLGRGFPLKLDVKGRTATVAVAGKKKVDFGPLKHSSSGGVGVCRNAGFVEYQLLELQPIEEE
ncbi:MAG: serine/threonine-protein kinase [Planctomycetaceae bacterium]